MLIRFPLEDVPQMGRVTKGVSAIKLAKEDTLAWAGIIGNNDEMVLFSERGYAKRIPGSIIDVQRRSGKGVRSFYFNKSGSNGSYVAAMIAISQSSLFSILQKQGEITPMSSEEIVCQNLVDKGKPYVMAIMENTVTDIII
jgi:DNA gyrase subunit A